MKAADIALGGMTAAVRRFDASAQRTARMGDPAADTDLAAEVVEQIGAKQDFKANLAVIRTADEMTKRLLDIRA